MKSYALTCSNQLKRNSAWGIGRSMVASLVFAASYPLYFHFIDLDGFGIWAMLMGVAAYFQLMSAKLAQAGIKFISDSLVQEDDVTVCQYASSLMAVIIAMGFTILGLTFLGRGFLNGVTGFSHFSGQLPLLIMLAAVITFLAMLSEGLGGIVSGTGRMDMVFLAEILCKVATMTVTLGLLVFQYGLLAFFIGGVAGYLVSAGLLWVLMRYCLGYSPLSARHVRRLHISEICRFSGFLLFGGMFATFGSPFNKILLGHMISPAAASIYEIAEKGSVLITAHGQGALLPLIPRVSGLKALADHAMIRFLCLNTVRIIFIWATPLFIIFYLGADLLIPLWLGRAAVPEMCLNLNILLVGQFIGLVGLPFFLSSIGLGMVFTCLKAEFFQWLVSVAVGLVGIWLIPKIWVVTGALVLGKMMFSVVLMLSFLSSWEEMIGLFIKALRVSFLPVIAFLPLFAFRHNTVLFFGCSGGIYFLYYLYLRRLKPAEI